MGRFGLRMHCIGCRTVTKHYRKLLSKWYECERCGEERKKANLEELLQIRRDERRTGLEYRKILRGEMY